MKTKILSTFLLMLIGFSGFSQMGKHGSKTVSGTEIVNEFTTLTANATAGGTSLTVSSSTLNDNGRFLGNLEAGDLIMIIQMKGADMQGSQVIAPWGFYGNPDNSTWGELTAYNNCGNHEFCEVKSVPSGTSIQLRCGLTNNYTATGNVQVIRIPRYSDLTIAGTLTAQAWNGTIGGIVSVEVQNDIALNGSIDVAGLGFRAGIVSVQPGTNNVASYAISNSDAAGAKGEGINGFDVDYDIYGGRYGRGAAINAGGGGNSHNGGGGGGGNAGNTANWNNGVGVPNATYNAAWILETPSISGISASGGGRGGYGHSANDANALTAGPNNATWGGHDRPNYGGLGGRPLDYSTGKIFFGGGGGAGQRNDNYNTGGDGGNGGGLVYILNYGNITGTGSITANGANGGDVSGTPADLWSLAGNDGAGGGGAGGTVLVKSSGTIGNITITANGGNGGNQIISTGAFNSGNEAEGPGGGGGGGYIATTTGTATKSANGGTNGTSNSNGITEFTPNGATSGGIGLPNEVLTTFSLTAVNDTICPGTTGNPTVVLNGSLPAGGVIIWYDAPVNGNFIGAGTSYTTTTNITSDTTFYAGVCPGNYLIPVSVIIGTSFTYSDAAVVVSDENCGQGDGSISGITVSGGALPLTYEWNGVVQPSLDISNLSANNYTLVITDNNGCSTTIGTYTVNNISSMTMNESLATSSDENCGQTNGAISGITVTGGTTPYTYSWSGNTTLGADTTGLGAGSYTLTVSDAVGCSVTSSAYTINNIAGPAINTVGISVTDESCSLDNGSITGITVSGGTTPYSYSWNGATNTGTDTTGLNAGSYTLVVTDALGCTDQIGPYTLVDNAGPTLDTTGYSITDETCGNANGSITGIVVNGGNAPLSYDWNGSATVSQDATNLGAGSYALTVTDNLGCTASTSPYVLSNLGLTVNTSSVTITDETCSQGNGAISGITITSGTPPYTYSWNGNTTLGTDTTGLNAGSFTLVITDGSGCSFTAGPYTVNNITGPVVNASGISVTDESCSLDNGSITGITVSGGTTPYSYSWNGATNTGTDTTGLNAGNYTLIVTDALGCTDQIGPYTLIDNAGPTLDTTGYSITDETCGNANGAISGITASGGNAPLSYDWNGSVAVSPDVTNLSGGNYTLTVTDNLGCTVSTSPYIVNNIGLTVDTSSYTLADEACSQGNGSITGITVSGGTPGYTYSWNGNNTLTPDTSGLNTGTYTLVITDAASCSFTAGPFVISNIAGPIIDTTAISIVQENCTGANGSITNIVITGGNGNVTYDWNGTVITNTDLTNLSAGNYTLTASDDAGCTSTMGPIVISDTPGPIIDTTGLATTDENCGDGTGSITGINVSGGTPGYLYTWNGTSTLGADTNGLNNGTYNLIVTDALGCTASISNIIISNQGIPTADFTASSTALSVGDELILTDNSSSDVTSFWWDFGNGDTSTDQNTSVIYSTTGTFTVCLEVTSTGSCTDSLCKNIIVTEELTEAIGVPQAFSPNGDNHNDVLFVRGQGISSFTFILYNRYGEKVFETTDLSVGWDGTFRGKPENVGVFTYYLEYEFSSGTKENNKGNITLIR